MAPKVATVIANDTGQGLTMKVGNRNCFVRYASVEEGGEYTMRLCVDWTYQEFLLEGSSNARKKLFVNSDDCCDYERITIKDTEGMFVVETVPRRGLLSGIVEQDQLCIAAEKKKPEKFRWRFWM